ncbi:stage III sporulation protein AE [Clostridium formicaceticum]|uniref:Stage III sporulation protein AE n=1 Tax=Clostridium formicaceticum TaxID=1497 RepID=A0AAC9WG60_9CLOT|nr:stage III sporulation protein AE [Clostridium formicaceticum]AOY77064.1 stage III sporulation protein AE [Clostridium formicaceticum]ARE87568.1 Stage III sporulation protein AE precursor [Clostridium formicaceticum]
MKKTVIVTMMMCFLLTSMVWGEQQDLTPEGIIQNQIEKLEIKELQEIMDVMNRDLEEYMPRVDIKQFIMNLIRGEATLSFSDIIKGSTRFLFKEVVANWTLLAQIIVLASICAVLKNLQSAFENEVVGKLAYNVCYLVIISITIKSFMIAIGIGRETIDVMVSFMQVLMPVLLAMLMAIGGITTSAILHPILLGAIGFVGTIIKVTILPLILFSAVLTIVNHLSSKIQVTKLAGLLKQAAVVTLGFILTAFIGIISIQGITASTVDGVTIRTAKFAVDKFIPIVGGFLSEAMDTVIGCSLVLKNAIGAIGLISIFLLCLMPMIKILALVIVYKLCAAVIEPISENGLVDCLNSMSNSLILLFATVSSVAIMFFLTITIIVSTGNITVMMR